MGMFIFLLLFIIVVVLIFIGVLLNKLFFYFLAFSIFLLSITSSIYLEYSPMDGFVLTFSNNFKVKSIDKHLVFCDELCLNYRKEPVGDYNKYYFQEFKFFKKNQEISQKIVVVFQLENISTFFNKYVKPRLEKGELHLPISVDNFENILEVIVRQLVSESKIENSCFQNVVIGIFKAAGLKVIEIKFFNN